MWEKEQFVHIIVQTSASTQFENQRNNAEPNCAPHNGFALFVQKTVIFLQSNKIVRGQKALRLICVPGQGEDGLIKYLGLTMNLLFLPSPFRTT